MAKKVVRYGVIGAGAIAQRRHLPEIHANPDSVVVAVCDPVKSRVREVAAKYDAKPFPGHEQMLADESLRLDAVVVATPNADHAPQTVAAFKAGHHVLVEKPMATTLPEARKMIAAAKKARKHLMIGMNQRLMPPHVKAKEILDTGKLGKVFAFETSFKHNGADGWSVDGAKSWFFKKNRAVMGVCGDLGVHKADLMRYLLGEEIVKVGGLVKTFDKRTPNGKPIPLDDNAYVVMETASGIIGTMTISWTSYGGVEGNSTTIFCKNGIMRIAADPQYGVMVDYANGQKERHIVGAVASNTRQVGSGVTDDFTRCILTRSKPTINGTEGFKALSVIVTSIQAASEGRFKKVPLK